MSEVKNVYAVSALNWATNKNETSFYVGTSFEDVIEKAHQNFRDRNYQMEIKAISIIAEDVNL